MSSCLFSGFAGLSKPYGTRLIPLAAVVLLCAFHSYGEQAEAHYVTQEGASLRDGSGIANAFSLADFNDPANWFNAVADDGKIGPGDTVYFSGTLIGPITPAGNGGADFPIVLDGYKGGEYDAIHRMPDPSNIANVVSPSEGNPLSTSQYGLTIRGKRHFVIQDFAFDGNNGTMAEGLVIMNYGTNYAAHIMVRDCWFHHILNRGIFTSRESSSDTHGSEYITIGGSAQDGNEFYAIGTSTAGYDIKMAFAWDWIVSHNKLWGPESGSMFGESGISWGDTRTETQRGLIEYNYVGVHASTSKSEDGIGGKGGTDIIIRCNKVENQNGPEGAGIGGAWGDSYRIFIYGNFLYNNEYGIWVTTGSGTWPANGVSTKDTYIWANVIAHTRTGDGIAVGGWDGTDTVDGVYIYNNTFVNNPIDPRNIALNQPNPQYSAIGIRRNTKNVMIGNNLFANNRPNDADNFRQIHVTNGLEPHVAIQNNLFYHSRGPAAVFWNNALAPAGAVGYHNSIGDPEFDQQDDGIYSLRETSRAREIGANPGDSPFATVTVQGKVYEMNPQDALAPSSDWTSIPPKPVLAQRGGDPVWDVGAYVYRETQAIGNRSSRPASQPAAVILGSNVTTGSIRFFLPRASYVDLAVFDINGKTSRKPLGPQWMDKGYHQIQFEDGDLGKAGIYLLALKVDSHRIVKKFRFMR